MAYGTRWSIETVNPYTGSDVEVFIKERDYSGSVTELDPGGDLVAIRYTPIGLFSGTPHWTMAASEATIEFVDDGTGQLTDVLSGDDEQFEVHIEHGSIGLWVGYVVPDSYGYIPYQRGIARLTATDRLGTLFGSAYLQSTGYVYSGRQSIIQIIANCVEKVISGLPFATHMRWYPYIGSNDLTTTDNPLEYLFLDNEIFYDDDGNPMSCGYVLEQICGRFQLQMMQGVSRWQLHQRRRTVSSNLFTVFLYDADGSPSVVTTTTYPSYTTIDGTTSRLASPYMTGSVPYGSVSVVYNHGNPFTDLFANRSFEKVMHGTVTGTPLVFGASQSGTSLNIDGLTALISIPQGMKLSIAGLSEVYELAAATSSNISGLATLILTPALESSPADNAAITFLENVGNWEYDDVSGGLLSVPTASDGSVGIAIPVDFETTPFTYSSVNYLRQRSREQVAGGSGFRIQGGWDVNVPNLDDVTTELYMAFRAYIDVGGTNYYYKWSDSTWTTTNTINEVPLKSYDLGNNTFNRFTFTTGELDNGGTPLTGYFYFEFLEGHEFNGGGSATTGLSIIVDNFQQPTLIDANYLPAGEATQTTITYADNVNRSKPDVAQFIFGDGPTTAHVRRLTLKDSTLTDTGDITGNWKYGPAVSASGYTLDQFWCDEILKQYRRSARRLTTGVFATSTLGIIQPWEMLRIENPNSTDTPEYAWMDMEYRPAAPWNMVSGTWVEVVDGESGNLLCEYSVPGASVAALSLTLEQGIPCATGGTEIAPTVPSGTLFFSSYDSSNSLITAYSMLRKDPDGTISVLKTFTGTPELTHAHDPAARWLLVVDGLDIWRMRFDGSDASLIFTLAGYDRIGDIDFIPTGTYAGELVFVAHNNGGGTNDDVYRIDIDGNETKISNNTYPSQTGIVVRNGTSVLVNTGFSNAGIVSYGLAGTVYTIENTTQIFNSGRGITYDPDQDQAYTERGIATSALARTPAGIAGSYTDFTGFGTSSRLDPLWFDRANQRIYYGGTGINYRAIGALNTAVAVAPLTGGSGTTGNYGTTKITVVQ